MDPLDYLRVVVRRWPVLVAVAVLGAVIGYATAPASKPLVTTLRAKSYTATYILALDPTSAAAIGGGGATSTTPNLASMAFLTTAGQVPRMAAKKLGYTGAPQLLAEQILTTPNTDVETLSVAATDVSASRATQLADAFATSLTDYLTQIAQGAQASALSSINSSLNSLQAQVGQLDQQIQGNGRPSGTPVEILQDQRQAYSDRYSGLFSQYLNSLNAPPARSPLVTFQTAVALPTGYVTPTKSKLPSGKKTRAAIGGLLGLLLAVGAVVGIDLLDPRIRSRRGVERAYRLPVLAELPIVPDDARGIPIVAREPSSAAADAYRVLRASLLFGARPLVPAGAGELALVGHNGDGDHAPAPPPAHAQPVAGWDGKLEVLLVTAADEAQGTSTVVANLAASLAEAGRSVLVISADFRRPAVHRYLGGPAAPGLTDALADGRPSALHDVRADTRVPGVRIVPSGTPLENEIELLTRAAGAVAKARELADIVIIDTPPLTAVSDASELIPEVDGVLFVCRQTTARVASARRAIEIAERINAPLLGVAVLSGSGGPIVGGRRQARGSRLQRATSRAPRRTSDTPDGGADSASRAESGDSATRAVGSDVREQARDDAGLRRLGRPSPVSTRPPPPWVVGTPPRPPDDAPFAPPGSPRTREE